MKGRILEGPQSWHGQEYPDRVEALLGDDWVVKFAGSADALWAELASAKKKDEVQLPSIGHQTLPMQMASLY